MTDESAPAATEMSPSTRGKILDAAESLFARFGSAGVGMRAIACGSSSRA